MAANHRGSFLLNALVDILSQSTLHSPFMLMYNCELVLSIDVKRNLDKDENKEQENKEGDGDEEQPFDLDFFDAIILSATKVEHQSRMKYLKILEVVRKEEKRDYDSRHLSKTEIKVDDIVLLKNNKPFDWKGVKFPQKWVSPYTVMNISDKEVANLKNVWGVTLKNKYNNVQLKRYIQGADGKSKSTLNKESANFWNHAPDEIVEIILLYGVQQSDNSFPGHKWEIYAKIKSTRCRWSRIIQGEVPALLPKIYIDTWKPLGKLYNGKIIVSTQKLTQHF